MTGRPAGGGVDCCMIVLDVLDRSAGWRRLRGSARASSVQCRIYPGLGGQNLTPTMCLRIQD